MGRLRPRARLIRTLGAELISSEVVAVLELVRNSYDADADHVQILFSEPQFPEQATLEIRDDGHGMDRETLLGAWLEPATDNKAGANSISPMGRRRLGSKGVGRFATQRLGRHLRVSTRTEHWRTTLEAEFDWDSLDRSDRYLDQLRVPWREIRSARGASRGTALHISKLNDTWTEERFERLRLSLARLVGAGVGGERFRITIDINGASEKVEAAIDAIVPMYALEGEVRDGGFCHLSYSDLSGASEGWDRTVLWPQNEGSCGSFRFRFHAWDLDREAVLFYLGKANLHLGLRDFRRVLRDHAGISLYRDGFRILPYGEPDNDWLRLDRRRVNNPTVRLSNNQLLGWVQLAADRNPDLRDQTNREGLVANNAYSHLQSVVLDLLGYLESRRFAGRRAMGLAKQGRTRAAEAVERYHGELQGLGGVASGGAALKAAIDAVEAARDEVREEALANARQMATGALATEFLTHLADPINRMKSEMKWALLRLKPASEGELFADTRESLEKVHEALIGLESASEWLLPLAQPHSQGRSREEVDLVSCLEQSVALFSGTMSRVDIELEEDLRASAPVRAEASSLIQVTTLLLQVAVEELRRRPGKRKIAIISLKGGVQVSWERLAADQRSDRSVPADSTDTTHRGEFLLSLVKRISEGAGWSVSRCRGSRAGYVLQLTGTE